MNNNTPNKITFDSVVFDKENKTMTILNGTQGTYHYKDIETCCVLNEKAKYHGKEEPFFATVPNGPLGGGTMWESSIFVGLKITMSDHSVLAIYTSNKATTINTDLHIKDKEEAEQIKKIIDKIMIKYHQA